MLQHAVDAALLSGTTLLCKGLNQISRLNQQLLFYHHLLKLAEAGQIVYGPVGGKLTVSAIKLKIKAIARKQDWIQKIYPVRASKKLFGIAHRNNAPHVITTPLLVPYAIERAPIPSELPGPYVLTPDALQKHRWNISGYLYRGAYRAKASAVLKGENLLTAHWKGYLNE